MLEFLLSKRKENNIPIDEIIGRVFNMVNDITIHNAHAR